MPANLSPEYMKAEKEYRAAGTPEEKLACLRHMLSVIPKHKGTDKLQGDLKHRIARMRDALERRTKKKGPSYRVRPEGAGQIMLAGPPNCGKSTLLAAISHAQPEIADYPCTTREPVPGMVPFEGVQFQLVDLPPVWREHCESFVFDNIRACDGVLVTADLAAADPVRDIEETFAILEEKHLPLVPMRTDVVRAEGDRDRHESLVVLNKADLDPGGEMLKRVKEMLQREVRLHVISARERTGLESLVAELFALLHVIRIFSKEPGKPPDMVAPYTVTIGSTVTEFAAHVHKDFAVNLRSARVWGSAKFDGQVVQRDHVLADKDVVELTMQG